MNKTMAVFYLRLKMSKYSPNIPPILSLLCSLTAPSFFSSFAGPLHFSTTRCLTSQTTAPAISSNTETTITPPPKPTTSAWLTPPRWKPKTRYENPLLAGFWVFGGHGLSPWPTQVDYTKYLPVNLVSSHPHYDREGNTYNMGTSIAEKGKTKYVLFKVPAAAAKGIGPLFGSVVSHFKIILYVRPGTTWPTDR